MRRRFCAAQVIFALLMQCYQVYKLFYFIFKKKKIVIDVSRCSNIYSRGQNIWGGLNSTLREMFYFYFFKESSASIDKIFFLGGRLGTRFKFHEVLTLFKIFLIFFSLLVIYIYTIFMGNTMYYLYWWSLSMLFSGHDLPYRFKLVASISV